MSQNLTTKLNVNEHVKNEQIKRNVNKQSQIFGEIVFAARKSKTSCIKKIVWNLDISTSWIQTGIIKTLGHISTILYSNTWICINKHKHTVDCRYTVVVFKRSSGPVTVELLF